MAANVEQDGLALVDAEGQRQSIHVGDADRVQPLQLSSEGMEAQVGLKLIRLQIPQDLGQPAAQVRVLSGKSGETAVEAGSCQRRRSSLEIELVDEILGRRAAHPPGLNISLGTAGAGEIGLLLCLRPGWPTRSMRPETHRLSRIQSYVG